MHCRRPLREILRNGLRWQTPWSAAKNFGLLRRTSHGCGPKTITITNPSGFPVPVVRVARHEYAGLTGHTPAELGTIDRIHAGTSYSNRDELSDGSGSLSESLVSGVSGVDMPIRRPSLGLAFDGTALDDLGTYPRTGAFGGWGYTQYNRSLVLRLTAGSASMSNRAGLP